MFRVILYKGNYAYDAVNVFIDELAAGFAALGCDAECLDLRDRSDYGAQIAEAIARPYGCIIAPDGAACRPAGIPAGQHMYDRSAAPFVTSIELTLAPR